MAVNLNLIPEDFAVKGGVGKTLVLVKQLNVILLALFIIVVLGISGYFFISSMELKRITADVGTLKQRIAAEQMVEAQMVLLKDRLGKIKMTQKVASAQNSLNLIGPVVSAIPAGSTLGELSVDSKKSDASVAFDSSQSLGEFFGQLITSTTFSSIILNSFGFNPATGYLASIRFVGK